MVKEKLAAQEVVELDQRIHKFIASCSAEVNELPSFMFDLLEKAERDPSIVDSAMFENLDKLFLRLVTSVAFDPIELTTLTNIRYSISRGVELIAYEREEVLNSQCPRHWLGYLKVVDTLSKRKFYSNESNSKEQLTLHTK